MNSQPRSALVCGWGAVEKTAASWHPDATITEIEPRLWRVEVGGIPIGMIGKEPWTAEEIGRRAVNVSSTAGEI